MDTHTTLRLNRLPPEILQIIAAHVRGYHIPGFVALASSSKTLRAICSPILFSAIVVEPPYDKIEATAARCVDALSLNGLLRYVRHLSLQLTPPRGDWAEPRRPLTDFSRLPGTADVDLDILMAIVRPRRRNTDILYDDFDDTDSLDHYHEDDGDYADVYPKDPVPPGNSSDKWVNFRVLGISLREFYLSGNKETRVDSNASDEDDVDDDDEDEFFDEDEVDDEDEFFDDDAFFDETEVAWRSPKRPVLNPRNVALVRSPNLHDIHFQLDDLFSDRFGLQVALALVGGISPNIKAVHITRCKSIYQDDEPLARNWAGVKDLTASPRLARLTTLALFDASSLARWNGMIDASELRSLSLGHDQSTWQHNIIWLAEHANFPNLKHLHLAGFPDFTGEYGWHAVEPFPRPQDPIAEFLARLPPLESLYIRGPVPVEVVQDMLPHHGRALQKLNIHSTTTGHKFTCRVFQLISEHCGMIQELHMPMRRTVSGLDESTALDALGNIKSVRILRLRFSQGYINPELEKAADYYASEPNPEYIEGEPSWWLDPLPPQTDRPLWTTWDNERSYLSFEESSDPPIWNGDIREALVKAAVDETFARAVWDRVSSGRRGCLRLLELYGSTEMQDYDSFPDLADAMFGFSFEVASMKTHFVLQRNMADDETFLAVDLHAIKMKGRKQSPRFSPEFLEHFGRTWPAKTGLGSWEEGWSSLPLPVPSSAVGDSGGR